jgi:predicted RNA-binding protein YlqC (UPF0109 family)
MNTKEVLETIIKALVLNPEKVKINENKTELGIIFEIEIPKEERKYVIGKNGSTFRALLMLIRKIGIKNKQIVHLKIKENEK